MVTQILGKTLDKEQPLYLKYLYTQLQLQVYDHVLLGWLSGLYQATVW